MYKYDGKLEASLPEPLLYGDISAKVYEKDGAKPTTIIRTDQEWGVKIYWDLKGSIAEYICEENNRNFVDETGKAGINLANPGGLPPKKD